MTILYHGTSQKIEQSGIKYKYYTHSDKFLPAFDFGEGFYAMPERERAMGHAACCNSISATENRYLYEIDIPLEKLEGTRANIYKFRKNLDWLFFVAYQRYFFTRRINEIKGFALISAPAPYQDFSELGNYRHVIERFAEIEATADIITGPIADVPLNAAMRYFTDAFAGPVVALHTIRYSLLKHQFVFKSKKSLEWASLKNNPYILTENEKNSSQTCALWSIAYTDHILHKAQLATDYSEDEKHKMFYDVLKEKEREYAGSKKLNNITHFTKFPAAEELLAQKEEN